MMLSESVGGAYKIFVEAYSFSCECVENDAAQRQIRNDIEPWSANQVEHIASSQERIV